MRFRKLCNGRALYVDDTVVWCARGMHFYSIDLNDRRKSKKIWTGSLFEKLLGSIRVTRQLLRIGIHHLIPLCDGSFFVVLKKRSLLLDKDGNVISVFKDYTGNKPGHRGVCRTPDGHIFFAEYSLNNNRKNDSHLFRSSDNGKSFNKILTFKGTEIRHFHFIQYDKYDKSLWLGTGDEDYECKLLRSKNNGDTWETIGEGSQLWRAIGISFTEDAVYWGTDAGSVPDPNYIVRMDRKSGEINKIKQVEGPCHGNASLIDGTVYVSTGVEGGENEQDHFARLYSVRGNHIELLFKEEKDIFPLLLQYGVIRLPQGMESTTRIIFTSYGLKNLGEAVFISYGE